MTYSKTLATSVINSFSITFPNEPNNKKTSPVYIGEFTLPTGANGTFNFHGSCSYMNDYSYFTVNGSGMYVDFRCANSSGVGVNYTQTLNLKAGDTLRWYYTDGNGHCANGGSGPDSIGHSEMHINFSFR